MNGRLLIPGILVFAALILLTVLGERQTAHPKRYLIVNLSLTALGLSLIVGVFLYLRHSATPERLGEELSDWARNMVSVYEALSYPVLLLLLVPTVFSAVSAIFEPKQRRPFPTRLRLHTSFVASAVFLFVPPFYAYLTTNADVPLPACIVLTSLGQALFFRTVYAIEGFVRLRESGKSM